MPTYRTQSPTSVGEQLGRLILASDKRFALAIVGYDYELERLRLLQHMEALFREEQYCKICYEPSAQSSSPSTSIVDYITGAVARSFKAAPSYVIAWGFESLFDSWYRIQRLGAKTIVVRAIQALNTGRSVLQQKLGCPLVVMLRNDWINELGAACPDFVSWASAILMVRGCTKSDALAGAVATLDELRNDLYSGSALPDLRDWINRSLRTLECIAADLRAASAGADLHVQHEHLVCLTLYLCGSHFEARQRLRELKARTMDLSLHGASAQQFVRHVERLVQEDEGMDRGHLSIAREEHRDEVFGGREREINDVTARFATGLNRVLAVWGDSRCGVSALLRQGVQRRLERLGMRVVYLAKWERPRSDVYKACDESIGLHGGSELVLAEALLASQREEKSKIVLILDDFGRLFDVTVEARDRQWLLSQIADCINDLSLDIGVLFGLRSTDLCYLTELDEQLPELLQPRNRYRVEHLTVDDAKAVVKAFCQKRKLQLTEKFVEQLLLDVGSGGSVRCEDLLDRLLLSAMCARDGSAQELDDLMKERWLRIILAESQFYSSSPLDTGMVLRALANESGEFLSSSIIGRNLTLPRQRVSDILNELVKLRLVEKRVARSAQRDGPNSYGLRFQGLSRAIVHLCRDSSSYRDGRSKVGLFGWLSGLRKRRR